MRVVTYRPDGTSATDVVPDPQAPPTIVNADTLRQRLAAFLALANPTAAQNAKAIKALVRLALSQLDDVSDT